MSDLVTRLRGWRNWREVHIVRTHLLLEEAADEIERLSENGDCPAQDNASNREILTDTPAANATPSEGREQNRCTITNAEREAVEWRRKGIVAYAAGTVVATIATAALFLSLLWLAK